jgi:hypothetical protein
MCQWQIIRAVIPRRAGRECKVVLGVQGASSKRIALPRACPPGRCREPERHARVAAAGSERADADVAILEASQSEVAGRGVGSSRPAEFAIFVTCADTADYPGSTGFMSSKSSTGATSYWASVVANPPGHMSVFGAPSTGLTLVAPAGSGRPVRHDRSQPGAVGGTGLTITLIP